MTGRKTETKTETFTCGCCGNSFPEPVSGDANYDYHFNEAMDEVESNPFECKTCRADDY